ncbi:unnamed protein product [Rotaria socialis]
MCSITSENTERLVVAASNASNRHFDLLLALEALTPSKSWVAVFPVIAGIGVIIGLAIWKRTLIKRWWIRLRNQNTGPKPLSDYINMTDENMKTIHAEYQELETISPQYRQSFYESEYASFDRYKNIPARELWSATAVRLTDLHRTYDYINANEIHGLGSKNRYIACQGPLANTCEDFWDMVIQYGVNKIVMLTKLEEQNPNEPEQTISKCYRYFPEKNKDKLTFNRLSVQVLNIESKADMNLEIRLLLIKDVLDGTKEYRVFHYYFTGWPDFSTIQPRDLLQLIEFINNHGEITVIQVEKSNKKSLNPIVVHCSAGVGRTGTYIAVDIMMGLIDQSKNHLSLMKLDIMGIVYQLRQDRGKMVQTRDQYVLVNLCVEEYLRRTNRINDVLKQTQIYKNISDQLAGSSSRTNLVRSKSAIT